MFERAPNVFVINKQQAHAQSLCTMKKSIQDGSRHLAYPASPNHTALSSHVLTDAIVLTDTLSSAGAHRECRLVQLLAKLEKAQVGVAHIHMLNIEED